MIYAVAPQDSISPTTEFEFQNSLSAKAGNLSFESPTNDGYILTPCGMVHYSRPAIFSIFYKLSPSSSYSSLLLTIRTQAVRFVNANAVLRSSVWNSVVSDFSIALRVQITPENIDRYIIMADEYVEQWAGPTREREGQEWKREQGRHGFNYIQGLWCQLVSEL